MLLYNMFGEKESMMRKLIIILGSILLIFGLVSCKSNHHKKANKQICAVAQPIMVISEDKSG